MLNDLNKKYGFDDSNQIDINSSKMRANKINPYLFLDHKNKNDDPELKLN